MAGANTTTAWDRLHHALHPSDPNNLDGQWYLNIVGTANIIGAGSGGTSQIDDSSFIPGGSSLTPVGGYVGGRTVASGHTAAPAMNASGMLIVAVGAGGAGGGLAQLQVVGSDNSTFQNVGYPSGGSPSLNAVPVNVVAGGGAAPATVGVYGSVSIIGSINPVGVFAAAGSMNVVGSVGVTPLASFTVNLGNIPTVNLGLGTVNVGNIPAIVGSVWLANAAAGNGFASAAVYGSPAFPVYVQFPSGYFPTVNTAGGGAGGGFASVAVYGSPAMPVYVIGSVNVVNQAANSGFASVAVYGSPANPVYVSGAGGSMGVTQLSAPWTVTGSQQVSQVGAPWSFVGSVNAVVGTLPLPMVGSVNITPVAAFSLAGTPVIDPRAGIVATQWPISHAGSGYLGIAGASANPAVRIKIHAVNITADNSAVVSFQSPSGTYLTGSMRMPGAAGFNLASAMGFPLWIGAANASLMMQAAGSGNIGGWLSGWVE